MNKVASVIKYDLSYFVRLILIVYLWLIGLLVGIPVLLHLVASGTEGMVIAILNDLSLLTTAALFVNVALLFYFGFLTYERFSFLIQNGISRRTGWYAKVISILIVALIGNIYSFITGLFALNGGSGYKSVPYLELYGHFFKSLPLDLVSMFIVNYIMLVMLASRLWYHCGSRLCAINTEKSKNCGNINPYFRNPVISDIGKNSYTTIAYIRPVGSILKICYGLF